MHHYGCSDYAVTADGGDFTVHAVWGLDSAADLWLVDGWHGKTASDVWIESQLDLMKRYKPLAWFSEKGVIQKAIEPMLRRRMRERRAYCRLEWLPSIVDKPTRARGFQARASMGKVHLPDSLLGHWFLNQLLKFPNGKHDDAVDVCSLIGMALDQAHPAIQSSVPKVRNAPREYRGKTEESSGWR